MFELTKEEFDDLRFQLGTSSWGGARYNPMVFTEHGALMAANILRSKTALSMSIYVVRAFNECERNLRPGATLRSVSIRLRKSYSFTIPS